MRWVVNGTGLSFQRGGVSPREVLMREIIDGLGYAPKTCTWELTLACNLRCGHCGSRAGKARPGELPLERSLEVAKELGALGCRRITLSGGECLMQPEFSAALLKEARARPPHRHRDGRQRALALHGPGAALRRCHAP